MDPAPLLDRVTDDEGLIDGLDEPEALLMVRTLADRVRAIAAGTDDLNHARVKVDALCRRGRQIRKVVTTLRDEGEPAARNAAAAYQLNWPKAEGAGQVLRGLLEQLPVAG